MGGTYQWRKSILILRMRKDVRDKKNSSIADQNSNSQPIDRASIILSVCVCVILKQKNETHKITDKIVILYRNTANINLSQSQQKET